MTEAPIPLTRPCTGPEELDALGRVLDSGWLAGQGPQGQALEEEFASATGRSHAVAVNNCTAALHLALLAHGIGPGDQVLVADYSFPATGIAVLNTGATAVLCDVRRDTGTLDVSGLDERLTPRTRALVVVDALGMPADWAPIMRFATERGLFLVADAACSMGSTYRGAPCGSFGDVAVISLHARKGITSGEGGVLLTSDPELAARARSMTNFGVDGAFERQGRVHVDIPRFVGTGYNYKISDLLAAVARIQLTKLPELVRRRRALADRYERLLHGVDGVCTPVEPVDRTSNWQTYAVRVDAAVDRDLVISKMRERGVGCTIGTYAQSRQPVFGESLACPVSDALFDTHLAIPMFPDLTEMEQERTVSALSSVLDEVRGR